MKILYVHERFGALAGAEANIETAGSELQRRGHATSILHGPPTGRNEAAWQAIFPRRFPIAPGAVRESLRQALTSFDPDVLFVHKTSDLDLLHALVECGRPLVRMVHDHDIYCMRSYKYHYFSRRICHRAAGWYCVFPCGAFITRNRGGRFPLKFSSYLAKRREITLNRRFDRMVVVTHYMRDELLKNGFDPRRVEIHPPVPRMGDSGITSNFSDRNLILYAGQIIRGKGVDVLLEALSLVRSPFECVILGDGSHRAHCERLARRLQLTDRVRFGGFVPQAQLKEYFQECSVFVISSVWPEPFATVGMEVTRYGIPIVSFDVGGISDWLKHGCNGFLVPWMDRGEYARRIDELLGNKPLARRMGEQGRALINKHYDFSRYISELEDLFHRVVAERRAGEDISNRAIASAKFQRTGAPAC